MHTRRNTIGLTAATVMVAAFILTREPRLISSQPLLPAEDLWCAWDTEEGAYTSLTPTPAAYQAAGGQRPAGGRPGAADAGLCASDGCGAVASREPVRFVQDPNPGFSSIRVDPMRNEVMLMDEFHMNIYVYDRLANTPASAPKTEPKRFIGGHKTLSQYNSDGYVDPKTGEIYLVNNDSDPGMNVYPYGAVGNVSPSRELVTPYGSFGMTANEAKGELYITVQHDGAILTWPKTARDAQPPSRLIQGARTGLGDPHGIAYDEKNNELFVANYGTSRLAIAGPIRSTREADLPRVPNWPAGNHIPYSLRHEVVFGTGKFGPPSIRVFAADASGDAAPLRVIEGPNAQLNWPTGVSVDAEHGEVYVANAAGDSINVYSTKASGNVAPIRAIKGPRTNLKNPNGVFVDVVNDEVWAANFGGHSATVYKRTATGDVAPIRIIRAAPLNEPSAFINNPYMIAFDHNRGQIIVPNCVAQPRIGIFNRMDDKNVSPQRKVEGQKTLLNRTVHAVAYDEIHDEIIVNQNIGQAILTFRGAANGEEAPIRIIQGVKTHLRDPQTLFVDPVHEEIYVINMSVDEEVLVFDRKAQGDVAPKRIIKGPDTLLGRAGVGAVDPINNLVFVSGQGTNGVLVFDRLADGNTKPLRVIGGGPKSGLRGAGRIVVNPASRKMVVTTAGGNLRGSGEVPDDSPRGFIGVWNIDDSGDVPPQWTIANGHLYSARGLTLDPKAKTVIVSDKALNAVMTFSLPEMFDTVRGRETARTQ
jgi:DNA-binding beta-propeller fold protein YncE